MQCVSSNLYTLPFLVTISAPNFGSIMVILHSAQLSFPKAIFSGLGLQPVRKRTVARAIETEAIFLCGVIVFCFLCLRHSINHIIKNRLVTATITQPPVSG